MRRRLGSEEGWAIVVAIAVMGVMLGLGLGVFAHVQGQQKQSGDERVSESSFNLAEAALNSATVYLSASGKFPTASSPYGTCTQASATGCPNPSSVASQFTSADYRGAPTWQTTVRDNGAPSSNFYLDSVTGSQPTYDANGDGSVWIRAEGVANGQKRILVSLVKSEPVIENFPRNAITAGKLQTTNSGKKVLIDTQGSASTASKISVRCSTTSSPSQSNTCLQFDANKGQVSPPTWETGSTGVTCPGGAAKCAMDDAALQRMEDRARANGTFYPAGTCPPSLTGAMVYVENATCSFSDNSVFNSKANPGVVIFERGSLTLGGNVDYYGLVYHANRGQSTGWVVATTGCAQIFGAVVVDYDGGVSVGSCGRNVVFDPNVFNAVTSNGAVQTVAGTFREIPTR